MTPDPGPARRLLDEAVPLSTHPGHAPHRDTSMSAEARLLAARTIPWACGRRCKKERFHHSLGGGAWRGNLRGHVVHTRSQ